MSSEDNDLGRLDLNLLNIFDMVMVERHVTRAAERLGLTQSAVSNALNRLRTQFEDTLFVKVSRGVEPTPRALALWPNIHAAIAQLHHTVRPGMFDPQRADTEFRMSMVDLSAALLTPYLFGCVKAVAPNVTISFIPHNPELTTERLARGEVDYAISVEPPRLSVLESRPLWSERYVIAGRRGHPALQAALSLEQLCALPQMTVNLSGSTTFLSPVDVVLADLGRSRTIHLTVNQFLVATAVLRESDLVAVLPFRLIADPFRLQWLDFQPLPIDLPEAVLHLIWHRRNNALGSLTWFRERILEATDAMNADAERQALVASDGGSRLAKRRR